MHPHLYAWQVQSDSRGSAGVADKPAVASKRVAEAFDALPDGPAEGIIQRVRVDIRAKHPSYERGRVMMRARRDAAGAVVFERGDE